MQWAHAKTLAEQRVARLGPNALVDYEGWETFRLFNPEATHSYFDEQQILQACRRLVRKAKSQTRMISLAGYQNWLREHQETDTAFARRRFVENA